MDKKRHVRKSNIFVDGRYRFGVNEQRILLSVISRIKISDQEFEPYRLRWSYIREITKQKIKSSADLNDVCERLKNKTVLIKEGSKVHGYGFLSGWTIEPGKWIEFRIDPCMKQMLLNLLEEGKFVLYKLECILSLSSSYSIRLYEILKSQEWKKQPVELNLEDLKWKLGVPKNSKAWNRFDVFRGNILEKAKKDLEKHTDIQFTYRKVLELRRVVALQFNISENNQYQKTVTSFIGQTNFAKDGDLVLLDGKEYVVEGDCIRLPDGPIPIGRVNQLIGKGVIEKIS